MVLGVSSVSSHVILSSEIYDYIHSLFIQFFSSKDAPKIVALCGSQRVGSLNKMLHNHAVKVMEQHGAQVNTIDLGSLQLPLYNPDDEERSFPYAAIRFKEALVEAGA